MKFFAWLSTLVAIAGIAINRYRGPVSFSADLLAIASAVKGIFNPASGAPANPEVARLTHEENMESIRLNFVLESERMKSDQARAEAELEARAIRDSEARAAQREKEERIEKAKLAHIDSLRAQRQIRVADLDGLDAADMALEAQVGKTQRRMVSIKDSTFRSDREDYENDQALLERLLRRQGEQAKVRDQKRAELESLEREILAAQKELTVAAN